MVVDEGERARRGRLVGGQSHSALGAAFTACLRSSTTVSLSSPSPFYPASARMGRLVGRLFVGFTLFLITFIGYSSQIFVIWPWYGREFSVELVQLLLPFKSVWSAFVHSVMLTRANAVYS